VIGADGVISMLHISTSTNYASIVHCIFCNCTAIVLVERRHNHETVTQKSFRT